jgi:nucleoredoxin
MENFTLLSDELINSELVNVPKTDLNNSNIIGLYFSGSYCPPCQAFTPILSEVYTELKNLNKSIEIVFISSDKDKESFDSYYSQMPWLALPYERRDLKLVLCEAFNVKTVPQLSFITNTLEILNIDGRQLIENNKDDINYIINELNL